MGRINRCFFKGLPDRFGNLTIADLARRAGTLNAVLP
jgi:hypothetical protein